VGHAKLTFLVRCRALNYAGSARSTDAQGRNTVEAIVCLAAKRGRKRRSYRGVIEARAAMPYIVKKVSGLAFLLLGDLAIAYGVVSERRWEILSRLTFIFIVAALLGAKSLPRNTFLAGGHQ
jgi:hypothetical protein